MRDDAYRPPGSKCYVHIIKMELKMIEGLIGRADVEESWNNRRIVVAADDPVCEIN